MKTRTTVAVTILSLLLICGGLGCVAMSKLMTPAYIPQAAVDYAVQGGVADPNDYDGYPNLAKAEALQGSVNASHSKIQLSLRQRMEVDDLDYSIHKQVVATSVEKGQSLENALFSETGFLAMGLTSMGFGAFTGFLGLMRKRPQDWAPEEVDSALSKAGLEGQVKGAQVVEIVKGIEKLKACLPDGVWAEAKKSIVMSPATREEVARIKANL